MKNKLILLIMGVFFPFFVNASEYSLSLSCPDTAIAGETISCSVNAATSELSGISAKYSLTNGLEYDSLVLDSGTTYNVNVCNSNGFSLGNTSGLPNSFKVGVLKVKISTSATANQKYTVSLVDLDGSDMNFNSVSGSSVNETIRIKSDNNNLSSLSMSGAVFTFYKDVLNYDVTINGESTTISGTTEDNNAKVTGLGVKSLQYGANKFEIIVTSELGTKKTYTINVTREDLRSSNNRLKSLSISNTNINYDGSDNYSETVNSDVKSVKIEAASEDSNATVEGLGEKQLSYGLNTFEVVVIAENGTKKTYTIKITRQDDRSNDNSLKTLLVGDVAINLDNSTTTYGVTVDANKENIELVATANSDKATINGLGTKKLEYGVNTFEITVVAENTKEKVYTLNITRTDDTNDNTLKSLVVSDTDIVFNGGDSYTVTVDNSVSKVNITAIANSEKAEVSGIGDYNLELGENKIYIKVVAANKEEKIYTINITRLQDKEINVPNTSLNISLVIVICALIFLIIGIIIFFKFKNKKEKIEII